MLRVAPSMLSLQRLNTAPLSSQDESNQFSTWMTNQRKLTNIIQKPCIQHDRMKAQTMKMIFMIDNLNMVEKGVQSTIDTRDMNDMNDHRANDIKKNDNQL